MFSTHSQPDQTLHPAATVVLLRASATDDELEVFLVQRTTKAGFMAAFHVFPGGRLEAEDAEAASRLAATAPAHLAAILPDLPFEQATAFAIGAIRETAEESGLLLAYDASGSLADAGLAEQVFSRLQQGVPFLSLLDQYELTPAVDLLASFGWWQTPPFEKRRYDTRFFLALAPAGQEGHYDAVETVASHWVRPAEAIAAYLNERIALAPPTLATLELLTQAATFSALQTLLPPSTPALSPHLTADNGTKILALPGDPLFPDAVPPVLPHRTRFTLAGPKRFI